MDISMNEGKALFVVAQIGQVRRAQELAQQLGITDATLAILYTSRNLAMPLVTEAAASPEIFSRIIKLEIPVNCNEIRASTIKRTAAIYNKLLDTVEPYSIFVCSYERHYSLLCHEARNRNLRLVLFEEGTAIYKSSVDDFQTFDQPTIRGTARKIYNQIWKNQPIAKYFVSPMVILVKQVVVLPKLMVLTIREIFGAPQLQTKLIRKDKPYFISGWRAFDTIYASDPCVLQEHFCASNYVEALPRFDDPNLVSEAHDAATLYGIDDKTAIFASQTFPINATVMAESVVKFLLLFSMREGLKVLIKLHPREKPSTVSALSQAIKRAEADDRLSIMEAVAVPAEYLAVYSDCPAVVSISSSTLIYAPKKKPGLRSVTIGKVMIQSLRELGVPNKDLKAVEDHVAILEPLTFIEHFTIEKVA